MQQKIKAGIIGAAGYTGGELIRLLLLHPQVEIVFAQSKSHAGQAVHRVHPDLLGDTDLHFSAQHDLPVDVLFLCMGHGESEKFLAGVTLPSSTKVIDLSQDFRTTSAPGWVYGLPELNRESIAQAAYIANPGCFATCIQLGLLPLAKHNLLGSDVHVSATTGSTGAGQALSATSHFSWRSNNVSSYKVFSHQHLAEIGQSLRQLQAGFEKELFFVPYRGSFTRGILATLYTRCDRELEEIVSLYTSYYSTHPFVVISDRDIDLKQVVNTNKCFLHLQKQGDQLIITGIIDNLLKGASGQAVQNMNLAFNLDETTGLRLKANSF